MAKRFIDSEIFRSPSIRALQAPYKLLWIYILNDCDHAGIWIPDFEICSIYLDRKYTAKESLEAFGKKIVMVDDGKKWWIPKFVEFQYGQLNAENRAHKSVLAILGEYGLLKKKGLIKPLTRPSQGRKDKDMDKDKVKESELIYAEYPRKIGKAVAVKAIDKALKSGENFEGLLSKTMAYAKAVLEWSDENKKFIPHPSTWYNAERYNDDQSEWVRETEDKKSGEIDHFAGTNHENEKPAYEPEYLKG